MKKIIALLLALSMLFALTACGGDDETTPTGESTGATTNTTESTNTTDGTQDSTQGTTESTTGGENTETTEPPTTTPPTTTPPTTTPPTTTPPTTTPPTTTPPTTTPPATEAPHTHSYSSKVTTAATCGKEGVKTFTCSCGHSYTEKIAATGQHSWKTATCTTPKTCNTCGMTEGSVSHDMYQHKCRICGYEDELLGSFDVSANQDGSVCAYIYKTAVDNEYALAFYGNGATKNFVTSGAPYYSLYEKIKHVEFGEGITRIGNSTLFSWNGWTIKSLKLPDTLIEIGESAFECVNLRNAENGLQLPNSLIRICNNAFEDATIGKLVIPDKVEYIGEDAFCGAWITNITFGAGIQQIERSAFSKDNQSTILTSLEKISYKNGYYVGDEKNPYYMLVGVSSNEITSLEIHPNTIMIYDRACMDCVFLKSISVPDNVRIIGDSAFDGCISLTEVSLGQGVERLNGYAFYNCSNLKTISIGKSLDFIGKCNFCYCYSLSEVSYNGTYQKWTSITCEEGWNYINFNGDAIEELHIALKCLDGDKNLVLVQSGGH